MHSLLPRQRFARNPAGDHAAQSFGPRCSSESDQTARARGLSLEPSGHPRRVGHRAQSSSGGGERTVRDPGERTSPPFPEAPARARPLAPISGIIQRVRWTASAGIRAGALALIRFYQTSLSAVLVPSQCRYYPSCSAYAYEAIEKWGVMRGVRLSLGRLLRCRPFGERGYDPVP